MVGHSREKVMYHMKLNYAVHDLSANPTKVPVDSRQRAISEVPNLILVVDSGWMAVMQERDCHYAAVNDVSKNESKHDLPIQ